jgi:hypothetical protein
VALCVYHPFLPGNTVKTRYRPAFDWGRLLHKVPTNVGLAPRLGPVARRTATRHRGVCVQWLFVWPGQSLSEVEL